MIMKKYKKMASVLCSLILICCVSLNVNAADFNQTKDIIDGSALVSSAHSTVTLENVDRGNILNKGTASIGNNGNGEVNVYGAVFGSVVCDKLILKMTLQRYSNGYWQDVKFFSDTKYDSSLLTKSYNVSVTKGYYYRVKAACVAYKGSTSESKSPVTDGIWID